MHNTWLDMISTQTHHIVGLPPEIGSARSLQELILDDNKMFLYPLSPSIAKLKALRKLVLSNNQLDEICTEIGDCDALTYLG